MHSYPEFIEDIKECFLKFIEKYNFQLSYSNNAKATLSNSYYGIEFNMDRMELDILVRVRGELFRLMDVLYFLKPEIDWDNEYKIIYKNIKYDSRKVLEQKTFSGPFMRQLSTYAILIDEHLNTLFEGDNNWVVRLNKKYLYEKKVRGFIWDFPPGHELYYLRNSGRFWLENVIEYCNNNNIDLPIED